MSVLIPRPIPKAGTPSAVISLLNSFTGVAAACGGFLYDNSVMLTGGILVGAAGTLLTVLMCKAMNRSLTNVLIGSFGGNAAAGGGSAATGSQGAYKEISISDAAVCMSYANKVIIVPGYGLAVAQAQHVCHELEKLLDINPNDDIIVNDLYTSMQFTAAKYNTVNFKSPENNLIEVTVKGAVEYPGTYTLNDDSSVEDLYQLVGGFKNQAFLEGVILTRQLIRERQIKSMQTAKEELNAALLSINKEEENLEYANIMQALSVNIDPENLGRLAGDFSPKSSTSLNTILYDGDILVVPKVSNSVNVFGEVLNPLSFEYTKNLTVKSAIMQAGGYKQFSDKKRVYVIRANGLVKTANLTIFKRNIQLRPGDTIVIPRKIPNNSAILAVSSFTQILSDLAFSAAALDNLNSN